MLSKWLFRYHSSHCGIPFGHYVRTLRDCFFCFQLSCCSSVFSSAADSTVKQFLANYGVIFFTDLVYFISILVCPRILYANADIKFQMSSLLIGTRPINSIRPKYLFLHTRIWCIIDYYTITIQDFCLTSTVQENSFSSKYR